MAQLRTPPESQPQVLQNVQPGWRGAASSPGDEQKCVLRSERGAGWQPSPPLGFQPAPVGSGQEASPAGIALSAVPPPSPKSHSTRSGSFVVGVLINFILINSVISSCLQNLR
jgi:hypothetical protein